MRVITLIIVGLMVSSSVAAMGLQYEKRLQSESLSLSFQNPRILNDGSSVNILMEGAPACLYRAGKPVLPMYTVTRELPFGSTIKNVNFYYDEVGIMVLPKKITLAPYPIIGGVISTPSTVSEEDGAFISEQFYPAKWVTYSTGGGLNEQSKHVTFLTLQVFPVRYSPGNDTLTYLNDCQITVTYEPPIHSPFSSPAIYNLVIITPAQFVLPLRRLADHKNSLGIRTQIKTLDAIYREYNGADKPEEIKFFIKDAVENWGATYVLLVGGLKSHLAGKPRDNINEGSRDWHFPVRYSNIRDVGSLYDPGFLSDLYYADIYDGDGGFCNWDSCGDGVYGGWSNPSPLGPLDYPTDQIDFYPDVYLGRIPCRNIWEVNTIVNKIITYETQPADQSWFKNIVVVGGDPYDDQGTNYIEGELISEKTLTYMEGYQYQRLYASYRETNPNFTPVTSNIVREITDGCGFLFFDGHGGPSWWNTNWAGEFNTLIENGGLSLSEMPRLNNGDRLPVCVVGGCHCCQFNVSLLSTITDPRNTHSMWSYGVPVPECCGWSLTVKSHGGAIATIGSTGLGYEAGNDVGDLNGDNFNEPDCVEALGGYLETQFFKAYGMNHIDILGDAWCTAIRTYLDTYPGMRSRSDAKTIEQWVLLGDPSLKIGGYVQ